MRKSRKTIAILAIIAMVLMMIPVQAFAADNSAASTRLSGATRVDTAIAIANSGWANGATNVVVVPANDANLVDALAVAPLAKQLNAPVLITDKDSLDASVSAEIATLKASKVYAVGALSDAVVSQLKALSGVTVTQVKGADRFATAAQIASMLTSPAGSVVVGYNGLADALSAASYAAANGYAILVANTDGTVPANEAAYEGSKVIVLGGPTLVGDIAGATRYYGADRYATNDQVIKNLTFKYDKVYVANGETLVDALSGAVLAALTNSPIVLANTQGAAAAADVFKNLTASSQVVAFGGAAVVPDSVVTGVKTGTTTTGSAPSGPVAVASVKASAANAFQVTFTAAPADTSKVAFTVSFSGTPVTATATWSAGNTQATLTGSANYAPGTYTIGVKNDATDLGSSTVAITQQTIAKIAITSKVMAVTTLTGTAHNGDGVADGTGFITYTVQDQYGNDITDSTLANSISWTPGISNSYTAKDGVIAITTPSGMSFNQYTSMSITGYDSTSGVSVSATLPIQNTGTLSGITLDKLTSPNNDDFNAGNTTGQWYIDYTAIDASGNPTDNFSMVNEGILNNKNINGGGFLNVQVVKDPNDNNKAAISVTINTSNVSSLVTDTQIPITVVTTSGKSSTLNVTLKKANNVDSVLLNAPAQMVASDESVTIPFTATDPTGAAITDYSKLYDKVTLSASGGNVPTWQRNSDGSASIEFKAPVNSTNSTLTVYLSATVTSTGKFSQITISIQKPKQPDNLAVDNTAVVPFMQQNVVNASGVQTQAGATQNIDFGWDAGGLALNDQYGRAMDMTNQDIVGGVYYYVQPTVTSGTSSLNVSGTAYNKYAITLTAKQPGTATVNYEVWQHNADGTSTDKGISKSVTYTVVKDSDITGYTLDPVTDPIKMLPMSAGTPAHTSPDILNAAMDDMYDSTSSPFTPTIEDARDTEYAANPTVWGQTSGGAKVVIRTSSIAAVSVDSGKFTIENPTMTSSANAIGSTWTFTDPGVNNFMIYANDDIKTSNPSATSASTTFTVTLVDSTGNYKNATETIKSTTDGSTVNKIGFAAFNETGIKGLDVDGTTVKVDLGATQEAVQDSLALINGKRLTRYDANGEIGSRSSVYFRAFDQFGSKAASITLVNVTASSFATAGVTATVDGSNNLQITHTGGGSATVADIQNGDYVVLSAVSANGQIATVKLLFQK